VARVALNLRGVKRADLRRGDALVGQDEWLPVTSVDVRLVKPSGRLPQHPVLHVGSASRQVHLRPLGEQTARLTWQVPLPLHVGERAVLRNPGTQHVIAGVVVLDVLPPLLRARGAAAGRALELAAMTGAPDAAAEVVRRGVVRRSALVAAGVLAPGSRSVPGAVAVADWLVDTGRWAAWQGELVAAVAAWRAADPLAVGMPAAALVQELGLPDAALLTALLATQPGLVNDRDGVHPAAATASLPGAAQAGLDALRERLLADPFGAAEADELRALGLEPRHLAIAVRSGRLVAVGRGIYLRPEAIEQAVTALKELAQPFALSEARQALATTRRVAVPLMELLDRSRVTERVDAQRRSLR
jgi:selenocysteine-specific elongation factor